MAKVELKNIVKIYGNNKKVIDNISLTVRDKEFLVLVGSSGCGKSTLLRIISGLETINQGEIFIDDICMNDRLPKDRDIAFVFQSYALYPHLSVYDNIAFPLRMRKETKDKIKQKVNEVSEILSLEGLLNRKPKELSGGQRQRVALGRAIVREPKVFLMDEPLSNLDSKLRVQMRSEIKKLHSKLNTTFIYVTHDQTEALTMGDRIAVLNNGVISQIDTPENIYNDPANTFVAEFIGMPEMNIFKSDINQEHKSILINGILLTLSDDQYNLIKNKKDIKIGIRPNDIKYDNFEDGSFDIPVVVDFVEILGDEKIIYFKLNDHKSSCKINSKIEIEDKLILKFNPKYFYFFDELGNRIK